MDFWTKIFEITVCIGCQIDRAYDPSSIGRINQFHSNFIRLRQLDLLLQCATRTHALLFVCVSEHIGCSIAVTAARVSFSSSIQTVHIKQCTILYSIVSKTNIFCVIFNAKVPKEVNISKSIIHSFAFETQNSIEIVAEIVVNLFLVRLENSRILSVTQYFTWMCCSKWIVITLFQMKLLKLRNVVIATKKVNEFGTE